jgi:hypothetical protein
LHLLKRYLQGVKTILIYWFETPLKNLLVDGKKKYLISQQMGTAGWKKQCPQ